MRTVSRSTLLFACLGAIVMASTAHGGVVFSQIIEFDLASDGAPDTAQTSDLLQADIGMDARYFFTDILISGDAGQGEQTFSAVTDLGILPPIALPNDLTSIAYDTTDPDMFPLDPLFEVEVFLGTSGSFRYVIEYQPDLSTGPAFTGTGSITIQAMSLGSFEFDGQTYVTTAIGAEGFVFFETVIPSPGSFFVMLGAVGLCGCRRGSRI